ncbi:hypothetical protein BHM03_00041496 [Ensete ventricosum]|uniref:Uncharacterized protein n=1 Tax=Ensete ventricosum TaxID=4639 RepID=A0A445MKA7_ENSVE|nr:hypothetical protein BHM03_00041496 [Ensete ventricosum]
MQLGTHLECVESSSRVSGACQDGVREFAKRRHRFTRRLSGVAEKLVESWEDMDPGSSLGIAKVWTMQWELAENSLGLHRRYREDR